MLVTRISGASSWQKCPTPGISTTGASGHRERKSAMARAGGMARSSNPSSSMAGLAVRSASPVTPSST